MKKLILIFAVLLFLLPGCSAAPDPSEAPQNDTSAVLSRDGTAGSSEVSAREPESEPSPAEPDSETPPERENGISSQEEPSEREEPSDESAPEEPSEEDPPQEKPPQEELPEEPQEEPSEEEPPQEEPSSEEPQEDETPSQDPGDEPTTEPSQEPSQTPELPDVFPDSLPQNAETLAYVSASGSYGGLRFYQKGENGFELILSCDATVGREGIGQASAWSTRTPAGLHPLTFAFGVSPDPGCPVGYTQVNENHYWCGDSYSPYYNRFVDITQTPDYEVSPYDEHLVEYTNSYAYAVWIAYNSEQTPEAGSAFFLHCENGYPTAGCVAVGREQMVFILQHLTGNDYIYITAE